MSDASGITDLFQNDTTASGQAVDDAGAIDTDAVAAAAATSGPGTQADTASSTSADSGDVRASGSPAAVPLQPAGSSGSGPAIDAAEPATDEPIPGSRESAAGATDSVAGTGRSIAGGRSSKPPVDDDAISHVFDQTNGVIEHLDGATDSSAASEELDLNANSDDTRAIGD